MPNENVEINQSTTNDMLHALFTGNFKRDTVVSEGEKIADASQTIFNFITNKIKKNIK